MPEESGLNPVRVEIIPKDMTHEGKTGLAKWILATWLPYVEQVPEESGEQFVEEFVVRYAEKHPPDEQGLIHVSVPVDLLDQR